MTDTNNLAARILPLAIDVLKFARWRALWALVLVLFGAFLEGLGIVLLIPLLDLVAGKAIAPGGGMVAQLASAGLSALSLTGVTGQLLGIAGFFAALMILRTVVVTQRQTVTTALQLGYVARKRTEVIDALSNATWESLAGLRHARITHLLGSDIHAIGSAAYGLIAVVVAALQLIVYFLVASFISFPLSIAAGILLISSAVLARSLFRDAAASGETVTRSNLGLFNDVAQFLGALKLAMSQNLQRPFAAGFTSSLDDLIAQQLYLVRRQNRMRMRMTIIGIAATVAAIFLGLQVLEIQATLLTTLIIVFSRMAAPFSQAQSQTFELVRTLPAFESMRRLKIDLDTGERARRDLTIPFGPISFRNLTYQHGTVQSGAADAPRGGVKDLSLELPTGAFIGIAGPSGGGKTTLLDLLVGLYAPQSGNILVANIPARLHLSDSWREQIAYVSQDSFMLNASVAANLRWGSPDVSDLEIDEALDQAGAKDLVQNLPGGLATVLGERGSLISGGERQRLALARALLRRPKLLILDEATNAIDIAAERQILGRLKALTPKLTIVVVAHRAESLAFCDTIYLMQDGRVDVKGSYQLLRDRLMLSEAGPASGVQ